MVIKELHLRNIASIENADIDFEKGLIDGVTGDPASIFLISGDTGAGKSVILDGISMALYKNTPRLSGAVNKKNNTFTDAGGESIRIDGINQYTRLGISEKDDCYSEVVFTGNDGKEYRARLTLGMTYGRNIDKTTGKKPFKHSTPKWEVQVDNGGWTSDAVEKTILDAVGLSFEQFGRMAMLAQGQFAAFLTGDKKERESILEQLTNTEIFSSYGNAIKSLYDKAKNEHEKVEVEYNAEFQHTLSQETVDTLTADKAALEKEKGEIEAKVKGLEKQIELVKAVESGREKSNQNSQVKSELEKKIAGEEYQSKKNLIKDWDSTSEERQRLIDLKEAEKNLAAAKKEEESLKVIYKNLSSDLLARKDELKSQGDPQKAVNDKQNTIDELSAMLNALEPEKVNSEIRRLSDEKAELSTISARAERISNEEETARKLSEEIGADEKTAENYKTALNDAQAKYDQAKTKDDEAAERLTTMSSSVKETLRNIRKRLISEHEDVCPLCGSHFHSLPLDEDFKNIVTPFEQQKAEAYKALGEATQAKDKAKSAFDSFSGALNTKRMNHRSKVESINADKNKLGEIARKFSIDALKPLPEQISAVEESMKVQETALLSKQAQAEELRQKKDAAQNEKKTLDAALKKFTFDANTIKSIENLENSISSFRESAPAVPKAYACQEILKEWTNLIKEVSRISEAIKSHDETIRSCRQTLDDYYAKSGKSEADIEAIAARKAEIAAAREEVNNIDKDYKSKSDAVADAEKTVREALDKLGISEEKDVPEKQALSDEKDALSNHVDDINKNLGTIEAQLNANSQSNIKLGEIKLRLDKAVSIKTKWETLNNYFGGTRFRTLVQTYILRPLLNNANIYLEKITDRYTLTCSEDNEQLSILVLDRYNKDQIRSATVLSGGERFMISLALSLALSSLNHQNMNVNILFIDEGFGTLDEKNLDSVMETLEKLQEIAGQNKRRVGIISHREELDERIPVQIQVKKKGEGRSWVDIKTGI